MPTVVIGSRELGPSVPASIQASISVEQWNNIYGRLGSLQAQVHSLACLVEVGVCVCFAFPCIFLCHTCIAQAMVSGKWDTEIRSINNGLFAGVPVLSGKPGSLVINTDLIPGAGAGTMAPGGYTGNANQSGVMMIPVGSNAYSNGGYQQVPQHAVVGVTPTYPQGGTYNNTQSVYPSTNTYVTPTSATSNYPATSNFPSVVPLSTPYTILPTKKKMMLVLPQDAVPGSVLTVASPDGQMLRVTVEPYHRPGQQIEVEY